MRTRLRSWVAQICLLLLSSQKMAPHAMRSNASPTHARIRTRRICGSSGRVTTSCRIVGYTKTCWWLTCKTWCLPLTPDPALSRHERRRPSAPSRVTKYQCFHQYSLVNLACALAVMAWMCIPDVGIFVAVTVQAESRGKMNIVLSSVLHICLFAARFLTWCSV